MSEWYCPLPFKHAYIESQGIAACCQTKRHQVTLDQWPTHRPLIKLQQDLLNGVVPPDCQTCVINEKEYGSSLRLDANRDYNYQRFDTTDIDFVDFRSVNICNFKCRSCNPVFSHGIAQEVSNYVELDPFMSLPPFAGKTIPVSDANIDWITNNLGSLKRIMLTGGEPTVIPGVRDLVERIKKDHKNIMVLITSNGSFQDKFWYELTEELANLHWTISIDVVGPRSSIVRHGSNWEVIEKNVTWLAQHANSLDINSVVSNLTIFGLRPLLEFGRKMQKLSQTPTGKHGDQGCRHQFFVTQRPYYLAANNLTAELQSKALTYLKPCLELELDSEQRSMLQGLIKQIESSEPDDDLWNSSETYNSILDRIRGENHLILFEEQQ